MPPNNTTSDGYEYGPTVNGKMYLSLFYHRGNGSKKDKHMWCVLPDHEYDIFFNSDKHDMYDSTQHYWGVLERGKVKIGERGERISKFKYPSNPMDAWHGYPIFPAEEKKGTRNALPPDFDDLIAKWIKSNLIARELGKKILKERS
jgi:hypothetical protein